MSLKLFRTTGYSSILFPGEARASIHPGWIVLAVSLWAGFACNVALWRGAASGSGVQIAQGMALGAFVAAACGAVLSLLGWRTTLKPTATVILFLAALAACAIWAQGLPLDASLSDKPVSMVLLPPWTSLLRWQVSALLAGLALVPMVWVWHAKVRRLPGPQQFGSNMSGALFAGMLLGVSGLILTRVAF